MGSWWTSVRCHATSKRLLMNWLRVLCRAEASRRSHGVGQPWHTRAVRSETCVRLRGRGWTGMRVIAVFFGPCTPDVLTSQISVFSHYFKRLDQFSKLATSSFRTIPLSRRTTSPLNMSLRAYATGLLCVYLVQYVAEVSTRAVGTPSCRSPGMAWPSVSVSRPLWCEDRLRVVAHCTAPDRPATPCPEAVLRTPRA